MVQTIPNFGFFKNTMVLQGEGSRALTLTLRVDGGPQQHYHHLTKEAETLRSNSPQSRKSRTFLSLLRGELLHSS